jgi:NAD(P)-dependent dehydrogenase (short-subunit alcohol dehydrogenase family)
MISLANKVSIVTGASSGIGRATAILFSQLGSKLAIVGRDESALDETIAQCPQENRSQILKIKGDLASAEFCKQVVEQTAAKFDNKISILVNCAGMLKAGSIETMKMEDFEYSMNVNVKSALILTQQSVPFIIAEKGSVVNVSSVTGTRAFPGVLPYCISKAALDQFTKCTALELADKGVRVNSVNPGVIVTQLHKTAGQTDEQYAKFLEHCKTTHALGRAGESSEVANTIAFLASESASFITGELIHVDGGRHAMTPR